MLRSLSALSYTHQRIYRSAITLGLARQLGRVAGLVAGLAGWDAESAGKLGVRLGGSLQVVDLMDVVGRL